MDPVSASNRRFIVWSSILVVSLAATGLCMRFLAVHGVSYAASLFTRGASCLVAVLVFARFRGFRLVPRSISTQAVRGVLAGLALTFFTVSYNWLTASAVSVLANVDVPLLIVLGPVLGPLAGVRASRPTRALAALSILFLGWFVCVLETQTRQADRVGLAYGLAALAAGSVLLCVCYALIKKSMTEENEAVTILVPSLALLAFGAGEGGATGTAWTPQLAAAAVLAGLGMFAAYRATMRLYELTDLASAEFPTLVSAVLIQPIEAVFLDAPLKTAYLLSSIGFVGVMYLLIKRQQAESADATARLADVPHADVPHADVPHAEVSHA